MEKNIKTTTVKEQAVARGMLHWLWLTLVVIVIDQLTKQLATQMLHLYQTIHILPVFNFTLAHNTGAAFSFLSDAGGWQRWLLAAIALLTSFGITLWLWRLPKNDPWMAVSLSLILGGAIGNLYDRLMHGYVIDFLDFYWGTAHFPAFNVADSAITVGAILMAIDVIRHPDK